MAAKGDNETIIIRVLPGRAARALFVRATLDKIFDYRRDAIAAIFGEESRRAA